MNSSNAVGEKQCYALCQIRKCYFDSFPIVKVLNGSEDFFLVGFSAKQKNSFIYFRFNSQRNLLVFEQQFDRINDGFVQFIGVELYILNIKVLGLINTYNNLVGLDLMVTCATQLAEILRK